jgi:predicted esterase
MPELDFVHRYRPGRSADAPTLLLLHGTGGNEDDLLELAPELLPDAGVLSPRGRVLERGMPRFFRRLAEGVFDLEDLRVRTAELADFVAAAAAHYRFDPARVIAVGFSNGANIAGSLLLLRPGTLQRAVLFRAMVPLVPEPLPALAGTTVLVSNGRSDPIVPVAETERLAALLRAAGAGVTLAWQPGGHNLTRDDVVRAHEWLADAGIRKGAER